MPRIEKDSLGEMQVPEEALWGAQTQRAVENFPISGRPLPPAFIHTLGDAHLYLNHLDQADEQLARAPLPLPQLAIVRRNIDDVGAFRFEDFVLSEYDPHPAIKAPIAV